MRISLIWIRQALIHLKSLITWKYEADLFVCPEVGIIGWLPLSELKEANDSTALLFWKKFDFLFQVDWLMIIDNNFLNPTPTLNVLATFC